MGPERLYVELCTYHTAPLQLPDASSVSAAKPISLVYFNSSLSLEGTHGRHSRNHGGMLWGWFLSGSQRMKVFRVWIWFVNELPE